MNELTIGIVGSGPEETLPVLNEYREIVDVWIGADRGALYLLENNIVVDEAVGDFDSVTIKEQQKIKKKVTHYDQLSSEKDETDLELAIQKAITRRPSKILMFGVTAGRKDHELINIQMLYRIVKKGIVAKIIDTQNEIELIFPGNYSISRDIHYPYISFLPFSEQIEGLTLKGFRYPLEDAEIAWGSTQCISNELSLDIGHLSYRRGILLIIKSRDALKL